MDSLSRLEKVVPADVRRPTNKLEPTLKEPSISVARSGADLRTQDQRRVLIEIAAYHIAELRGFEPGHEVQDWVEAESQIDLSGPFET